MLNTADTYRVIAGMPLGTMANSMRADDWASLSEAVVPMYTDEQNIKHQEEIGKYLSSPPESSIADVVHMAGERPSAPTDIIAQTGARAWDVLGAASWMTDMANYVNQVTGHPNVVIQMGYGVPTSTVKPGSTWRLLLIKARPLSMMRQQPSCGQMRDT